MSKHLEDLKRVIEKCERIEAIVREHGITGEVDLHNVHRFLAGAKESVPSCAFSWGLLFPLLDGYPEESDYVKTECALHFEFPYLESVELPLVLRERISHNPTVGVSVAQCMPPRNFTYRGYLGPIERCVLLVKYRLFGGDRVWRIKFTGDGWWEHRDSVFMDGGNFVQYNRNAFSAVEGLLRACHLEPTHSSRTVSEGEALEVIAMFASYYAKLPAA